MSNYRFIMKTADSIVSNEDGRLVMEDRDEWAKTEYASGDDVVRVSEKSLALSIQVIRLVDAIVGGKG